MADKVISFTSEEPCACCGDTPPPVECACALLIPQLVETQPTPIYTTLAAAIAAIAAQVASCRGFIEINASGSYRYTVNSFTQDFSVAGQYTTVVETLSAFGEASAIIWNSVNLTAGPVNIHYDVTFLTPGGGCGFAAQLMSCADGSVIDSNYVAGSGIAGSFNLTVPSSGEYYLVLFPQGISGETQCNATMIVTQTGITANPVIAQWDDSGTTRQIWACPKLLIPPLTESMGDSYTDCADAFDAMDHDTRTGGDTGPLVSNCIGFMENQPSGVGTTEFTATAIGSILTLNVFSPTNTFGATAPIWAGINVVAGESVSFAWDYSDFAITWTIYDDTGTSVDSGSGGAGTSPSISGALPYTGRYTIKVAVFLPLGPGMPTDDVTITVTSSGTMSTNQIQALSDGGRTCLARLDCGDACP